MIKPSIPLLALRTFVEVGHYGSIKTAAQVLNVTSGAVSQQIRLLEERVGTSLFIREHHGVRLTEAGAQAHPLLHSAFGQIESVVRGLEGTKDRQVLTISTVPAFAASWLVPRLGSFTRMYPQIEVRVETTSSVVDLRRDRVDIALRHGLGHYPDLHVTRLITPMMVPVGSPELLGAGSPLKEPEDCLNYPLLHDADRADWALWLTAHGVAADVRTERGSSFEDDLLLIRAAESGQGLALVSEDHAQREMAAGKLVKVLDKPWPAEFSYYIVSQKEAAERSEVRAFSEWLLSEAQAMRG
ncbi:LysR substrate-binding domain-containing protein [Pseudomonas sp. UM16]|uniref:LysR substrate-binding domain-containing protein n=1 Tax=Pseudomonas sp. UM16 TaxID=3158962 RepID=UPI00398FBC4A